MKDILKIAAAAVTATMCAIAVKRRAQEVGLVLPLTAGALVLIMTLGTVESVRALMNELDEAAGLSPAVLTPVLKIVGTAILTRISAEVCRDAKESGVTAFVETARAIVVLCVAPPLLRTVLDTVAGLL